MKKAFTLIELLVVILIIGILAAVALPQYQKAVEKSRMTEAKLALKNLYQGYQLCELSYGKEADECCLSLFEVIATPLPGEIRTNECIDDSCVNTKDWQYGTEGCGTVYANRMPADASPYYLALDLSSGEISCSEEAPSFCNEP